ncbi:PBAN-type neuropeptides [Dendroctonus ponderosae]|nr:PBAN-type neuropeptides [Dendroctonus ponderosae]
MTLTGLILRLYIKRRIAGNGLQTTIAILPAMIRISVLNSFLLLIAVLYYATDSVDSFDPAGDHERKESSPMWFGPRIGRKKRNPKDNEIFINSPDQPTVNLLDMLRETPMVVLAFSEAFKQHNFVPRLGRESGESLNGYLENNADGDVDSLSSKQRHVNNFPPRLNRNTYNPYSPRLGRESDLPFK